MTTALARRIASSQAALSSRPSTEPSQPKTLRRFTVWRGSDIPSFYESIEHLCENTLALVPPGVWDEVELLVKAGEGGSWQAAFDPHPLAISNAADLAQQIEEARAYGVRFTPYVVARGKPSWIQGEQAMIRQCVGVAKRCNINVEPGAPYWNGGNEPSAIRSYISGANVPASTLEVTLIPRQTQVNELGGAPAIQAWTDPTLVGSASWETYGVAAGVSGSTSLLVNEAMARLDGWGVPADPQYRIAIPQRSERLRWADTPWCAVGMQVWHLDGD